MDDPPSELVGTVLAERYRIEALLGAGGMGAVYRATHVFMQKTLAIKVLHRDLASVPEVIARFEREAVAAASVNHPNVATAIDFGQLPDGAFYLAMEYVDGAPLREHLVAPLPPVRVVRIGMQIAAALQAAHDAGIVHRDLKPENIMIKAPGEEDLVKVLDLGIAKVPLEASHGGKALTQAGTVLGTPQYMAPEQAAGKSVDGRADLYALGVVLYEMISGAPPFPGDDVVAQLAQHLTQPPPPLPDHVPEGLARLIMRLLEKRPEQRPASAAALHDELALCLTPSAASEEVVAVRSVEQPVPPTDESPARQRSLRRRVVVALAALAALLLATLGLSAALGGTEVADRGEEPTAPQAAAAALAPAAASVVDEPRAPAAKADNVAAEPPVASEKPPARSKPARAKGGQKKADKRKTGPGGIYVPPPEEWF